MTSRQRMKAALSFQKPDRPPADLGSTPNTSITRIAYKNLRTHLGLPTDKEPRIVSQGMQVVEVEEDLLERLKIDTRGVFAHPPDNNRAKTLDDGKKIDEWGLVYRPAIIDGELHYYDVVESSLAFAETAKDIETFDWHDPLDPGRTRGLKEETAALRSSTESALVGHMGDTAIFQQCCLIRGMEQLFVDLMVNKELAHTLLSTVTEIQSKKMERYLEAVGEYLDVVAIGDDLAQQAGPLISPALFREMVKPYLAKYAALIKSKTDAPLHLHSCGSVVELLDDLIEIGIDIINPVQVSARDMAPEQLLRRFGGRICFWGGIDTQHLLPRGTPEEVRAEVRRVAGILGQNGGYVLDSVHNIQPDVPPENIVAMYEALR